MSQINFDQLNKIFKQLHPSVSQSSFDFALKEIRKHLHEVKLVSIDDKPPQGLLNRIQELQSDVNAYALTEKKLETTIARLRTNIFDLQQKLNAASSPKTKVANDDQAEIFQEMLQPVLKRVQLAKEASKRLETEKAELKQKNDALTAEQARLNSQVQALDSAKQTLESQLRQAQAQAAARPAPVNPNPQLQKERDEYRRIAQYLGEFVSEGVWDRCLYYGRAHAEFLLQDDREVKWPTNPDEIVGEVNWAMRRSPRKAKQF
jgi:chromosome segregation ATPase